MESKTYRLKDLYCAAWIYSQGISLVNIDRDGGTCWFNFEDEKKCTSLASEYWTGKATGSIKAFSDAIRSLKDMVFAQR